MIQVGQPFPKFSLPNQDGKTVSLSDFAGKWLVVYVYPKDDTPGCTIQGKSFTATKQEFDDANIAVVGVSEDDVESHKSFCNKFAFTIDLLADPKHELLQAAGVGQSDYKGTMYWNRTSFVIDPSGNLRKLYEKVNPEGHERVLLDDIKAMQAGGTPLTPAELRLLPYLQTHLTFREIGQRLFLSRNTVSSEVGSIYRKMGVSSRSDAVQHATAIGLLAD